MTPISDQIVGHPVAPQVLDVRAQEILRLVVEQYLETGSPVGSRQISRILPLSLSPATVRNVMADLEALGLIIAPHTSAGRLPTDIGLRFFVDTILNFGDLSRKHQEEIQQHLQPTDEQDCIDDILVRAGMILSSLSSSAGLVMVSKSDRCIRHTEFIKIGDKEALAVLVSEDGSVENRLLRLPAGITPSTLSQAANWINTRSRGKTVSQARIDIGLQLEVDRNNLDSSASELVRLGVAFWSKWDTRQLIVRGRAQLLQQTETKAKVAQLQHLMTELERKEEVMDLLCLAEEGDGVRIFIGAESQLLCLAGSTVMAAPVQDDNEHIVGVLGIIGPTRLDYARIVPMVDFTARAVSSLLGSSDKV